MGTLATPIAASLGTTDFIVELVTSDLDDDTARRRARGDEGPSIAWVVGHMLHYRHAIMKLLGHERDNPFASTFGDDGASAGDDYPDVSSLRESWRETAKAVHEVLGNATDKQIMAPLGGADSPHGEKKVLDTLVFYMWHEAYHMGQLGTLRTQLGLTPTAELAIAASQRVLPT